MTLYAIGDLQGCDEAFARLLDHLQFDPAKDRVWLVGDLVNRGPKSLAVLRRVMSLGDSAVSVLGNHDLHLLAVAVGARKRSRSDTFSDVLAAKDSDELLDWLRHRPLLHHDKANNRVLVHAGIPPRWTIKQAVKQAADVASLLAGEDWRTTVKNMYGNTPTAWSKALGPKKKLRYTINGLTRMRFCDQFGNLDLSYTGPPGTQPKGLMPWFRFPNRAAAGTHIIFGHWATLGIMQKPNLTALDSGCVWGRKLTAVALKKRKVNPRVRIKCK